MMQRYEKYISSGQDWIGDVPKHWSMQRAKWLFNERVEKNHPNELLLAATQNRGVIPKDELEYRTVTALKDFENFKLVKPNDFVISLRSFEGGFEYSNYQGIISPAYTVFFKRSEVVEEGFWKYFFKSYPFLSKIRTLVRGIRDGQNINLNDFQEMVLPVPPPEEQIFIAQYLEEKTKKIDELVTNKQKLIGLEKEKRNVIISTAVSRGIDPKAKVKSVGFEWLGDIPENWQIKKLKYVAKVFRGKFTHRPRNDEKLFNGPYPFIQTGEVAKAEKYVIEYSQSLNEDGYKVTTEFPVGTLLMTIAANIGEVAILGINACFPDSIVGFYPFDFIDNEFLFYKLKSLKEVFLSTSVINTQMNLNIDRISSIPISFPQKDGQIAIVRHIEAENQKINETISKIEREIDLLLEYRTALISEAVTGKARVNLQ